VMAFVPEHRVIMWAETKVFLYRHDPDGKYPVAADAPPRDAGKKPGKDEEREDKE